MTPRFAIFAAALSFSTLATAGYVYWNWLEHSAASTTIVTAAAAEQKASITAIRAERRPGRPLRRTTRKAAPFFRSTTTRNRRSTRLRTRQSHKAGARFYFYRNPMGLPDTSPVPKKDPMGMDYIPVYEGDAQEQGGAIKLSVERIQRSGVRTEPAQSLVLMQPVRAVGAVALDERRLTVVSMRSEGYVEDLFVDTTGQTVRKGEPLFRVYSPDIQQALADLLVVSSRGSRSRALDSRASTARCSRLRNSAFLKSRIRNCARAASIRAQSTGRRLRLGP